MFMMTMMMMMNIIYVFTLVLYILHLAAITSKSQTNLQLPPYVQYLEHPAGIFMILNLMYVCPCIVI